MTGPPSRVLALDSQRRVLVQGACRASRSARTCIHVRYLPRSPSRARRIYAACLIRCENTEICPAGDARYYGLHAAQEYTRPARESGLAGDHAAEHPVPPSTRSTWPQWRCDAHRSDATLARVGRRISDQARGATSRQPAEESPGWRHRSSRSSGRRAGQKRATGAAAAVIWRRQGPPNALIAPLGPTKQPACPAVVVRRRTVTLTLFPRCSPVRIRSASTTSTPYVTLMRAARSAGELGRPGSRKTHALRPPISNKTEGARQHRRDQEDGRRPTVSRPPPQKNQQKALQAGRRWSRFPPLGTGPPQRTSLQHRVRTAKRGPRRSA